MGVEEWGHGLEVTQKEYIDDDFGFPSVPFVDKLEEEHTDVEVPMTLDEKPVDDIEAQDIKKPYYDPSFGY
jgi:hypothetical protein